MRRELDHHGLLWHYFLVLIDMSACDCHQRSKPRPTSNRECQNFIIAIIYLSSPITICSLPVTASGHDIDCHDNNPSMVITTSVCCNCAIVPDQCLCVCVCHMSRKLITECLPPQVLLFAPIPASIWIACGRRYTTLAIRILPARRSRRQCKCSTSTDSSTCQFSVVLPPLDRPWLPRSLPNQYQTVPLECRAAVARTRHFQVHPVVQEH